MYDPECGLATQILGHYLVPCVCNQQVMEVINRADPIFDMYMRGYNLSIDSVWGHRTDVKYLTTRIVRELLPPMC